MPQCINLIQNFAASIGNVRTLTQNVHHSISNRDQAKKRHATSLMTMKCVSRNKFLLCFRPVVDVDTTVLETKGSGKLSCISDAQGETEDVKLHQLMKRSISENKSSGESNACHARKGGKRNLSRLIRAVMFQTILSRRARNTNCFGHKSAQFGHSNREDEPSSNTHAGQQGKTSMPLVWPSSSDTTAASEPKNCSQTLRQGGHSSKHKNGIFLLIISLTITVLFGRLCATFITLFWLCFVARRH